MPLKERDNPEDRFSGTIKTTNVFHKKSWYHNFPLKGSERWQEEYFLKRYIHECNIDDNFVVMDYDLFQLFYPTHFFFMRLRCKIFKGCDFATKL